MVLKGLIDKTRNIAVSLVPGHQMDLNPDAHFFSPFVQCAEQ